MNAETRDAPRTIANADAPAAIATAAPASRPLLLGVGLIAVVALAASAMLWQRLGATQEQLARQSADSGAHAVEARAVARQAQEQASDAAARVAVLDARLNEVALQRTQLEELMQSLSRSRDENLVVDIESSIRLAQQQAQLTGSVEPLLAALSSAEQRIKRTGHPRLAALQRALTRDVARIKTATLADLPALLVRLDELVRLADELPLLNAPPATVGGGVAGSAAPVRALPPGQTPAGVLGWWQRSWEAVGDELRGLVRVSRIDHPEAALLSPEQSFFLRENYKLKLLNARLGLLARQHEAARTDLQAASAALDKYFDGTSRKVQATAGLLRQAQGQMKALELPRVDETLAALAASAAGR